MTGTNVLCPTLRYHPAITAARYRTIMGFVQRTVISFFTDVNKIAKDFFAVFCIVDFGMKLKTVVMFVIVFYRLNLTGF